MELDGDITAIAAISNREPLRVMERMNVNADQFSGDGHANVVAHFPVGRKSKYHEVDWNILVELRNGSSTKKFEGRKLTGADLLVDANPVGAKVTGTMKIDGIHARVNFVEPIGKSGSVKRKREIHTTLDEEGRLALGVDLKPVIDGPVDVVVVQEGGKERYELDFSDAKISLPWVGWSKGATIPAKGGFILKRLKKGVRLENFSISGAGFGGKGTLQLDKRGLVAADISELMLNEGDAVNVKVERTDDTYFINASGSSYDARGIINSIIHQGGFKKAQGGRSVNLEANFKQVKGFQNRVIGNAELKYVSRDGSLYRLDMSGVGENDRFYSVNAQLNDNQTLFVTKTNDAGNALAFTNIYTRMSGGLLEANLVQSEQGPYIGPVQIRNFEVVNEERLRSVASGLRRELRQDRNTTQNILPETQDRHVRFLLANAQIERGQGYFRVSDASMHNTSIGLTFDGTIYDPDDNMNVSGTFMPANGVNLAVSAIPLLGQLLSNGRDNGLFGVTYQLKGPRNNPELLVNPLSIVAPGVFNKVFEFQK